MFDLISFDSKLIRKRAINDVIKCNDYTEIFGLVLTQIQALELIETHDIALSCNGRIEFNGGIIEKIIKEFCDSPYISMHNYTQTLSDLVELFYYYKNETLDLICDDDLIKFIKSSFDGVCQGSLDLLSGRELYQLTHNLRFGFSDDYYENNIMEDEYGE